MQTKEFDKLISKYAIILSLFYTGHFLLTYFGILYGISLIVYFFSTNIVVALLVNFDLKRREIKSPITVWSCVFFEILGVAYFFIQLIRQENKASA